MAFNPFHTMRKNSKAVLAVVTIFIMILFVLGSGIQGGDFFNDVLPRWFGGHGKDRGTKLAAAYGEDIYNSELHNIQNQRMLANEFMLGALDRAHARQIDDVDKSIQAKRVSDDVTRSIRDLVKLKMEAANPPNTWKPNEVMLALQRYELKLREMEGGRRNPFGQSDSFDRLRGLLMTLEADRKEKEADYQAVRTVFEVLSYDARQLESPQPFFDAIPNRTLRDALTFKLFLLKADQLGIRLPRDVVNERIVAETRGHLRPTDSGMVLQAMQRNRQSGISGDMVMHAIGNELKVRAALAALGGYGGSSSSLMPAYLTPYDFFQFYKDNLSEIFFSTIRVPVQDFVAKVTEEPKEEDLRQLFNAKGPDGRLYRAEEPDPMRETPGFKEP